MLSTHVRRSSRIEKPLYRCEEWNTATGAPCNKTFGRGWNLKRHIFKFHKHQSTTFVQYDPHAGDIRTFCPNPPIPENWPAPADIIAKLPSLQAPKPSWQSDTWPHQFVDASPALISSIGPDFRPTLTQLEEQARGPNQATPLFHQPYHENAVLATTGVNLWQPQAQSQEERGYPTQPAQLINHLRQENALTALLTPNLPAYEVKQSKKRPGQQRGLEWLTLKAKITFDNQYRNLLAEWGVAPEHNGTCVLVPQDWIAAEPMKMFASFTNSNYPGSELR